MLIADGHHRYGISRTYRDEVRAAADAPRQPAELTLTFVGELVAEQLSVEAIHRLYAGVDVSSGCGRSWRRRSTYADRRHPTPQTLAAMAAEGFLVLVGPTAPSA